MDVVVVMHSMSANGAHVRSCNDLQQMIVGLTEYAVSKVYKLCAARTTAMTSDDMGQHRICMAR